MRLPRTCLAGSLIVLVLAVASSALPATRVVTTLADDGPGSLREAIESAGECDRIEFAVTGTIVLTSGPLVIDRCLEVAGPGAESITISGEDRVRVIEILPDRHVRLAGVTLAAGNIYPAFESGTALHNRGVATLAGAVISSKTSPIIRNETGAELSLIDQSMVLGSFLGFEDYSGIVNEVGGLLSITDSSLTGGYNEGLSMLFNAGKAALTRTVVIDFAGYGGASVDNSGELTMRDCQVSRLFSVGLAGVHNSITGTALFSNTTISENTGGSAGIWNSGSMDLVNCTVSRNSASGGFVSVLASGIVNSGSLRLINCTVSDNGDETYPLWRPPALHNEGWVEIKNTIVAAQRNGVDCENEGTLVSLGHNIESDGTCGFDGPGDMLANPLLGPLADNGGPTLTHALLAGSPAIDAGSPDAPGATEGACEAVDQRGVQRPLDGDGDGVAVCDIGAFERAALVLIDIEPVTDTNPIKALSRGVMRVAILGSGTFDVTNVDVTTLAFGPSGAPPAFDLTNPFAYWLSHWDVNHDGEKDLLSHYRTEETGIAVGDTEACLTGEMLDGRPFEGCDVIETVPGCGHGFETALVVPPLVWIGGRMRRRRHGRLQ